MVKGNPQYVFAAARDIKRSINAAVLDIADLHGVLVTELTHMHASRKAAVVEARADLVHHLARFFVYRDERIPRSGRIRRIYRYGGGLLPEDGWRPISLNDLAAILGGRDHTTVLHLLELSLEKTS